MKERLIFHQTIALGLLALALLPGCNAEDQVQAVTFCGQYKNPVNGEVGRRCTPPMDESLISPDLKACSAESFDGWLHVPYDLMIIGIKIGDGCRRDVVVFKRSEAFPELD